MLQSEQLDTTLVLAAGGYWRAFASAAAVTLAVGAIAGLSAVAFAKAIDGVHALLFGAAPGSMRRFLVPIIASGGLHSLKDVQTICDKLMPEGVVGAIAGRALYEGAFEFKSAQSAADQAAEKAAAAAVAKPPAKG